MDTNNTELFISDAITMDTNSFVMVTIDKTYKTPMDTISYSNFSRRRSQDVTYYYYYLLFTSPETFYEL